MKPPDTILSPAPTGPATPAPSGAGPGLSSTRGWWFPSGTQGPRCRVAGAWATGSQFQVAIARLLLQRLRLVGLIALAPTLLFLVRRILEEAVPADPVEQVGVALHACVTLLLAVLTTLVWSRNEFSLCSLRKVELALFGSLATFFAWLQLATFNRDVLPADLHAGGIDVPRLVVAASAMRWFFLIVIYGVFIPNNWLRCAVVVTTIAVTPLLLTLIAAIVHGCLDNSLVFGLTDLATLLFTGVAVAAFGSYRLEKLQKQAFEAQQLGQYRLKQRLGGGGMGEVFLAEHVLLRRPCAIKLIRPEQAGDPMTLERFEREVKAMATLTHWNTAMVFDYGHSDDGTFYYVMEYLPGPTLENLVVRHGPLPPDRAIHLLRQVCRALHEAHEIGLLHRDVKPSNVLVCDRGGLHDVVKLLDFGLVHDTGLGKATDRLTVLGTVLGSPPYMSPEQAAGRTDIDARADIYAVGAVGYFLLTGQPPFERETAMQMLLAHAYEPVVPPSQVRPTVPADLEAVVLRCLSKKPEERFPNVHELDKALAACADADHWTEEKSEAWWKSLQAQKETDAHPVLQVETLK